MVETKTIIRTPHGKDRPYFSMARTTAQDESLSWEALGMLTYLLSKPDDWEVLIPDLMKRSGRERAHRIISELVSKGYITRPEKQEKDSAGKFVPVHFRVHESAQPVTEKPYTENPQQHNTDIQNGATADSAPPTTLPLIETKKEKDKDSTSEKTDVGSSEKSIISEKPKLTPQQERVQITERAFRTSTGIAIKYAAFLGGALEEKDSAGRSNGEWYIHQVHPGMETVEIRALGMWLDDTLELQFYPSTAEGIGKQAARFRMDDDHALYMKRAQIAFRNEAEDAAEAARPVSDLPVEDHKAEIDAAMQRMMEGKRV
jgi:hypothetical protein